MKHILEVSLAFLFVFLVFSFHVFSQNIYKGFMKEFYLDRQPSARAIEMGGCSIASNEYDFSYWYNPATLGLSEPVTTNFSYIYNPYSESNQEYFSNLNLSFNSLKYGAIGFSANSMRLGNHDIFPECSQTWNYDLYNVNYAIQPIQNFYTGINLNFLSIKNNNSCYGRPKVSELYPIDIGVLKIFPTDKTKNSRHNLVIGTSLYNLTNVKYENTNYNTIEPLPVILRLGTSYGMNFMNADYSKNEINMDILAHIEIEKLLNSGLYTVYKAGAEVLFADLISLRIGLFSRKLFDKPTFYENQIQFEPTGGIGLKLPLSN